MVLNRRSSSSLREFVPCAQLTPVLTPARWGRSDQPAMPAPAPGTGESVLRLQIDGLQAQALEKNALFRQRGLQAQSLADRWIATPMFWGKSSARIAGAISGRSMDCAANVLGEKSPARITSAISGRSMDYAANVLGEYSRNIQGVPKE